MSVRSDRNLITVAVGTFIAFLILLMVVACNNPSGNGSGYYPHDSDHGYYDTHHHYHYYHEYGSGKRVQKPGYHKKPGGGYNGSKRRR